MMRILTVLSVAILSNVSLPSSAEESVVVQTEHRLAAIKARLDLSEEQITQMAPVLEESMAASQRILASYGIDLENREDNAGKLGLRKGRAMRNEIDTVRAETLSALETILTEDQLVEFKKIQNEREAEMRERIRGG
jgi:hypothetical protein